MQMAFPFLEAREGVLADTSSLSNTSIHGLHSKVNSIRLHVLNPWQETNCSNRRISVAELTYARMRMTKEGENRRKPDILRSQEVRGFPHTTLISIEETFPASPELEATSLIFTVLGPEIVTDPLPPD